MHHLADEPSGERGIAGNRGARDAQPLGILDRSLVLIGHADREGGHVVHEEIREMLGRDDHQRVGPRGLETLAHAAVGAVEFRHDGRIGQMRATRDARRMARDSGEHQTHTPATFSSSSVVM